MAAKRKKNGPSKKPKAKRNAKPKTKAAAKPKPKRKNAKRKKNPPGKPGAVGCHDAAVALAHCNGKTRKNPLDDAEARREYQRVHWGDKGNQRVTLETCPTPRGTLVNLGELVSVTYRTVKRGDGLSDYEHRFHRDRRPKLAFNPTGLIIVGGSYVVTERGIEG